MNADHGLSWEDAVQRLKATPAQWPLVQACFYDDPLLGAAMRYHASTEWQAVRGLLSGHGVGLALDLGSGRGISAYALARDGWQVTALEPDPSPVVGAGAIRALAKEAGLAIRVVETWGEQLPFAAASFDLVHCRQVLHHARDLAQLCREVARVLRPGGLFMATREHVISQRDDLQSFLDNHPLHRLYGGEHAYLQSEYIAAIHGAGIRLEKVLNPYQSDINAYPDTLAGIKHRWARRWRLPSAKLIPDAALGWAGALRRTPGRLFTFVGRKAGAAS
jgi:SAM-dependent methyltransferase